MGAGPVGTGFWTVRLRLGAFHNMATLTIEIDSPVGTPLAVIKVGDFRPQLDQDSDLDLVAVHGFGIAADGTAYYSTSTVPPGESARLGISPNGEAAIIR